MKDDFDKYLEEQLKNKEFRKEWEALQPEYTIMKAMIEARTSQGLTQKELSIRSGIAQGDISKMETGNANPSIKTLQRLASAMGKKLKISFVDPEDIEMLQDLILAAVNDAMKQAQDLMTNEMGKLTGGLKLPGLF